LYDFYTDSEYAEEFLQFAKDQPYPQSGIAHKSSIYREGYAVVIKMELLETPEAAKARMEKLEKQRERNKRLQKQK
jgi:hypothetical protein